MRLLSILHFGWFYISLLLSTSMSHLPHCTLLSSLFLSHFNISHILLASSTLSIKTLFNLVDPFLVSWCLLTITPPWYTHLSLRSQDLHMRENKQYIFFWAWVPSFQCFPIPLIFFWKFHNSFLFIVKI